MSSRGTCGYLWVFWLCWGTLSTSGWWPGAAASTASRGPQPPGVENGAGCISTRGAEFSSFSHRRSRSEVGMGRGCWGKDCKTKQWQGRHPPGTPTFGILSSWSRVHAFGPGEVKTAVATSSLRSEDAGLELAAPQPTGPSRCHA